MDLHDPAGQQDVPEHPFHSRSEVFLGHLVVGRAFVVNSEGMVMMVHMDVGEVYLEAWKRFLEVDVDTLGEDTAEERIEGGNVQVGIAELGEAAHMVAPISIGSQLAEDLVVEGFVFVEWEIHCFPASVFPWLVEWVLLHSVVVDQLEVKLELGSGTGDSGYH